ncbi:hypothetical protein FRC04_001627 [Tulasnella sp. 424]|nr:hypothetical protein FRC04_001627 [Tulasnella sp. 424]
MAGKKRRTSTITKSSDLTKAGVSTKKARADPTTVPELLANVLSFATHSALASCAVVCKPWSEVALDYLWRDLDSVFPLLELVMDIHLLDDLGFSGDLGLERFSNMLSGADWSRFQIYAGRVKHLSYENGEPYRNDWTPSLDPNGIALLCLRSPSGLVLLPRLKTLEWSTDESVAPIFPFLSPQLESLEVELTGTSYLANDFFSTLAGRIPNLKSFTLKTPIPSRDIEGSLQKVISSWKNLEALKLPPYYLRPSILEAAASLPNLIHLDQDYTCYPPKDVTATLQELPQDAFLKLETFAFNANPAPAKRLLRRYSDLFTRLTEILLNAMGGINNAEVLEFTRHLGSTCPRLIQVSFDLSVEPGLQKGSITPLSIGVIESLFPCRDLEMLEIGHPFPLTLDEDDVERMAAAWPKLTTFYACHDPDLSLPIPGDMGNSLSILQAFARHHPMVRDLGLFFAKDKMVTFSGDLYPEFEFHCLETISVGTSAVPGGRLQDAGFLIASLCKPEPTIDSDTCVWYVGAECPEWEEYKHQWEEAVKHMEFAMRIKSAGRERMSGIVNLRS